MPRSLAPTRARPRTTAVLWERKALTAERLAEAHEMRAERCRAEAERFHHWAREAGQVGRRAS